MPCRRGRRCWTKAACLGQVTRVYPPVSEVTLMTDRDQAIPVLNARTGARGLAFGDAALPRGTLELRYMDANVDMAAGDLLTTSGVDGVYPPGLPVARVLKMERRVDSAFARIYGTARGASGGQSACDGAATAGAANSDPTGAR